MPPKKSKLDANKTDMPKISFHCKSKAEYSEIAEVSKKSGLGIADLGRLAFRKLVKQYKDGTLILE